MPACEALNVAAVVDIIVTGSSALNIQSFYKRENQNFM